MDILISNADGFDRHAGRADVAVITFTREEVETGRIGSAIERLLLLSDRADHVLRFAGRVVLMFEGYDHDPRPLVEIPACVSFIRAVDQHWNYWLHFLLPEPDVLKLLILMLVDAEPCLQEGERARYRVCDPVKLAQTLERLFAAMNALHDANRVPEAVNRAITAATMRSLDEEGR